MRVQNYGWTYWLGCAAASVLLLSACAVTPQDAVAKQQKASSVAPTPAEEDAQYKKALHDWLRRLKTEARGRGVSDATWKAAMSGFKPIPKIISLDRKQPEGTVSFPQYLAKVVNGNRIREGQRLYRENKKLLDRIATKYQVPAQYIVALWGVETSYGKVTGGFSVPQALATLAHDGRRADFFREEFIKSLLIIEQGHISAVKMRGSWAGAMGQSQFMPSAFLDFAVDENGDGHKDIWNTKADVFASIANYLHKSGWKKAEPWAIKVQVPTGFNTKLADIKQFSDRSVWAQRGITKADGSPLGKGFSPAALMYPGKPHEGAYLISGNASVVLKWNRSRYFATSVGTLADSIKAGMVK